MSKILDIFYFLCYSLVGGCLSILRHYLKGGYEKTVAKNLRVKAARAALDMTQKDLAESIGISRQTMNAIEKGDYYPSVKLCIEICKVLGKTLDELFWED